MNDPLDHLGPDELIEDASRCLLTALAKLDGIRRALRGERELPEKTERLNVVPFSARPKRRRRVPGAWPRGVE